MEIRRKGRGKIEDWSWVSVLLIPDSGLTLKIE